MSLQPTLQLSAVPRPGPDALAHSAELTALVHAEIERAGGCIGFERFMELVLYRPGLGYYSAGARKFGAAGDFVTAPEISSLFARCVARQVHELLSLTGTSEVLEVGAGSGRLAADILQALKAIPTVSTWLPLRYSILERSADLRERQRETLRRALGAAEMGEWVTWRDALPARGFEGVVLANELLDALPAALFEWGPHGFRERVVTGSDGLRWATRQPDAQLAEALERRLRDHRRAMSDGYQSELGRGASDWTGEMAGRLSKGAMLLIDYGYPAAEYYHPQRVGGTLRCHYRHLAHEDPFLWPGLQDISVHVDFSAIAAAGTQAGLELAGFSTQGSFLLGTGLLELAAERTPGTRDFAAMTHEIKRLTLPGEMGDAVKVLAFTVGELPPLTGFRERDLRGRL